MDDSHNPAEKHNQKMNPSGDLICPWCGQITRIIWVHGHGQCALCHTNIDECCRGEKCLPKLNDDQE